MIHTDVLKFIEHIIFINIAIFEGMFNLIFINIAIFESMFNLIFIIKLFLKKKFIFIYNDILLKLLYYSII